MTLTEDLYQLEQIDAAIEADEAALAAARAKPRAAEADVDDITAKIDSDDKKLYSGSMFNPKELTSLQHEVGLMKERRDELENAALGIIDGGGVAGKTGGDPAAGV